MRNLRLFADQYEGNSEPNLAAYAHAGHCLYAHKATEGVGHIDHAHNRRAHRAHEQGLTVLHYHFCRPDQHDPQREVGRFWIQCQGAWMPGDFVGFDFEPEPPIDSSAWTLGYLETLWNDLHGRTGEGARVYGSTDFLTERVRVPWLRRRPRWEANYSERPGLGPWRRPWWAWQGNDGEHDQLPRSLEGIGTCDVSVLNLRSALTLAVRTHRRRWPIKHKGGQVSQMVGSDHGLWRYQLDRRVLAERQANNGARRVTRH